MVVSKINHIKEQHLAMSPFIGESARQSKLFNTIEVPRRKFKSRHTAKYFDRTEA